MGKAVKGSVFEFNVEGNIVVALFDTGASYSLISFSKAKDLKLKIDKSDLVECFGLGGIRQKIHGSVIASIHYGHLKTSCKFYVTENLPNEWDAIIGTPYMRDHECCIQYTRTQAILHVGSDGLTRVKGKVCKLNHPPMFSFGDAYNPIPPQDKEYVRRENINKCSKGISFQPREDNVNADRANLSEDRAPEYLLRADKVVVYAGELQAVVFRPVASADLKGFPFGRDVIVQRSSDSFSNKLDLIDQISRPDKDGSTIVYVINKTNEPVRIDKSLLINLQEFTARTLTKGDICCSSELDKKFRSLKGPTNEDGPDLGLPIFTPLSDEEKIKQIKEFVHKNVASHYVDSVLKMLLEFREAIYVKGDKLGATTTIEHKIELDEGTKSIYVRQYKLPETHRQEINRQVSDMIAQGLVEEAESEFNSPLFIVKQKDKLRIVVDFRRLNAVTKKSHWPIPDMASVLSNLGESKFFSSADLASGYHQIPLAEKSRDYCTFSTDRGSYRFLVLPFGLCNAPATCARLMSIVLAGLPSSAVLVYLDDLLILGKDLEDHLRNFRLVLKRLTQHGLRIKLEKCTFLTQKLNFLGHTVDLNGVRPNDAKLRVIADAPAPTNASEIKSFLGLISFYRDYIPNCSTIAEPLIRLTKKNVRFVWGPEQENSFLELKDCLRQNLTLAYPNFSKPFILYTDADFL